MKFKVANTTLELGLGKLLGGMSTILGKSGLSNVISKSMSKVLSNKATRDFLAEMGSEFTEEYLQEIIDTFVRNKILGENNEIKLISEEALIAGLSGVLNSGISNYPKFKYNINKEKLYTKENVPNLINNQSQNGLENSVASNAINEDNINLSKVNNEININNKSNIFSQQIDEVLQGNYPKRDMLIVSENTPKVLQELGLTRLADNNGDIIVASIKIDGKGQINDVQLNTNAYGKSNNYDYWMQDNIKKGNMLYDIDEGIINTIDKNNTQKN